MSTFPNRRLRRLRKNEKIRELVQETRLSTKDFICPVFIQEDLKKSVKIDSMPDIERFPLDGINDEVDRIIDLGIPAITELLQVAKQRRLFIYRGKYDS